MAFDSENRTCQKQNQKGSPALKQWKFSRLFGKNRVGFIKDITEIFAINKVNILNLISNRSGNEEAPIRVTFIPKNHEEAQKIVKEIKKIEGVKKIESKTK